ncbi:MAG: hypothetical protein WC916_07215 [Candidatus Woesearchaeota archaeon]
MIILPGIVAVGIQSPPKDTRIVVFEPYKELAYTFNLVNADYIHSYKNAPPELDSGIQIIDTAQDSGPRSIAVNIILPETLAPGKYVIYIGGKETRPGGGTVGGVAAIQSAITIISLYQGIYPEYLFTTTDVGVNQTSTFSMTVHNYGSQTITAMHAVIDIYSSDNTRVGTITTSIDTLGSNEEKTLQATLDAAKFNLQPGTYKAVAKFISDGKEYPVQEREFRVGSLKVDIVDWTPIIYVNTTNKFQVFISSDWASPIENVYAKIYTPDKKVVKTPNLDVNKFQRAALEGYIETTNYPLGKTQLDIEVFYASTSVRKTVQVDVAQAPPSSAGAKAEVEEPKQVGMNTTTLLIIIGGILVLILINILVFKKKTNSSPTTPPVKPPKI